MTRQQAESRWPGLADREWKIIEHMNYRNRVNLSRTEKHYMREISRLEYKIRQMKNGRIPRTDKQQPVQNWNNLSYEDQQMALNRMMGNVDNSQSFF